MSGAVSVCTVAVGHEGVGSECWRRPAGNRHVWLEIDWNEDAGVALLIRESDPLLCQHGKKIVGVEASAIRLESQAP